MSLQKVSVKDALYRLSCNPPSKIDKNIEVRLRVVVLLSSDLGLGVQPIYYVTKNGAKRRPLSVIKR